VEGYKGIREGWQDVLDTPLFMVHWADDDMMDVTLGREMKGLMEALGFSVEWWEYNDGGHWIQEPQGINDLVTFLDTVAE
jgi:predicted esterase